MKPPGPGGSDDFAVKKRGAGLTRLELATSGVTDRHSNRLSYSPFVLLILLGIARKRHPNLASYTPTGN